MDTVMERHCTQPGVDPEWFFPDNERDRVCIKAAKAICAGCPFREPCQQAGRGLDGIWGGKTPRERA